jgi:hypothetical protein
VSVCSVGCGMYPYPMLPASCGFLWIWGAGFFGCGGRVSLDMGGGWALEPVWTLWGRERETNPALLHIARRYIPNHCSGVAIHWLRSVGPAE